MFPIVHAQQKANQLAELEALVESQRQQLKAVKDNVALIEFTPQGEIITANGQFLAATGYSLSEITGKHHRLFWQPGDNRRPRLRRVLAAACRWESPTRDIPQNYKKRRNIVVGGPRIFRSVTPSGRTIQVLKIAYDVTDRQEDLRDKMPCSQR